ncbi:hypothetical protein [Micromonospora sp. NPDC007230]|uniref:hypothetical protein n=1 Tax=Micromonospora sp. NPDC007230 TaxID=3364237 RepID=UPI00368CF270
MAMAWANVGESGVVGVLAEPAVLRRDRLTLDGEKDKGRDNQQAPAAVDRRRLLSVTRFYLRRTPLHSVQSTVTVSSLENLYQPELRVKGTPSMSPENQQGYGTSKASTSTLPPPMCPPGLTVLMSFGQEDPSGAVPPGHVQFSDTRILMLVSFCSSPQGVGGKLLQPPSMPISEADFAFAGDWMAARGVRQMTAATVNRKSFFMTVIEP